MSAAQYATMDSFVAARAARVSPIRVTSSSREPARASSRVSTPLPVMPSSAVRAPVVLNATLFAPNPSNRRATPPSCCAVPAMPLRRDRLGALPCRIAITTIELGGWEPVGLELNGRAPPRCEAVFSRSCRQGPAPSQAALSTCSRLMFHAIVTSDHSPRALSRPFIAASCPVIAQSALAAGQRSCAL
jgi:hypothetical protein